MAKIGLTNSLGESFERLGKKAAQPVKQMATDVARDVSESLGFSPSNSDSATLEHAVPTKTISSKALGQIKTGDAARLQQIRQNLARINQDIVEARKKREQKYQERTQQAEQKQQQQQVKKVEEVKKESVLQKLIKSRKGTKESMARASGWEERL